MVVAQVDCRFKKTAYGTRKESMFACFKNISFKYGTRRRVFKSFAANATLVDQFYAHREAVRFCVNSGVNAFKLGPPGQCSEGNAKRPEVPIVEAAERLSSWRGLTPSNDTSRRP
jgi:hypothetical protein